MVLTTILRPQTAEVQRQKAAAESVYHFYSRKRSGGTCASACTPHRLDPPWRDRRPDPGTLDSAYVADCRTLPHRRPVRAPFYQAPELATSQHQHIASLHGQYTAKISSGCCETAAYGNIF